VGGLGPHAHLTLEREILRAVHWARRDQDYPPWVLVSRPQTPDRTAALLGSGSSPGPFLVAALRALAEQADFAVLACITAHAFLQEIRSQVAIPILDVPEEAIASIAHLGHRRAGVLATTGTLRAGIFSRASQRVAPQLELVSLLDLPRGETLQRKLVMDPIYGGSETEPTAASLKAGSGVDARRREALVKPLRDAAMHLVQEGADVILLGCTEIPLALGHEPVAGVPLLDPLRAAAEAAVTIARGGRDLPGEPSP